MAMVNTIGRMVVIMRDNGKTMPSLVKEFSFGLMGGLIKVKLMFNYYKLRIMAV